MKEQKFLITHREEDIQYWLDREWEVISVTSQRVSASGLNNELRGKFAVLLQKQTESEKKVIN